MRRAKLKRNAVQDMLKTREQIVEELQALRARVNELEVSAARREADRDRLAGVIRTVEDTTAAGLAEEKRRRSQERLAVFFQESPDIMAISSVADGRFMDVNTAFERLLGYSGEEAIGRTSLELGLWGDPYDRERLLARLHVEKVVNDMEIDLMTKSGGRFPAMVSAVTVGIDGEPSLLITARDITTRKGIEDALRESEERFRLLAENAQVLIYRMSLPDGRFEYVSPAAEIVTSYTVKEWLTNPMLIESIIHPDWRSYFTRQWIKLLAGEMEAVYEYQIIDRAGKARWLHQTNTVFLDDEGQPLAIEGVVSNITDRKKTELALMESEAKFSTIFHSSPEIITIISMTDTRILEVNESFTRVTGYGREEVIGRTTLEVGLWEHAEDRARMTEALQRHGVIHDQEFRFRLKDDRRVDALVSAEIIEITGTSCLLAVIRDITDRKREERTLAVMNKVQEVFLKMTDDSIYAEVLHILLDAVQSPFGYFGFIDEKGNHVCPSMTRDIWDKCRMSRKTIVFPRESWKGIWGASLTQGETLVANGGLNVPTGHIPLSRAICVPVLFQGSVIGQFSLANKETDYDEHDRALRERIAAFIGPILYAYLGRKKEERVRERVELALRESEVKYRTIVEQTTEWIWEMGLNGVHTFSNPAITAILGYRPEELSDLTAYCLIHEEDRPEVEVRLPKLMAEKRGWREWALRWRHKDGTYRFLESNADPIFDSAGHLQGYRGADHDVTDRKQMEELILASLKEKEVLLQEMHHRVKNNLQVISSLLDLQSGDIEDEGVRTAFNESKKRIHSISLIHEQLYRSDDFARIDLAGYTERLCASLLRSYGAEGRIRGDVDIPSLCLSLGAAIPCGLIINELVMNCLKHAFPDERQGNLRISMELTEDGMFVLRVKDNGVGFPSDVDIAHSSSLGLTIVATLARQLKGRVELRSDGGAEVVVVFPESPAEPKV